MNLEVLQKIDTAEETIEVGVYVLKFEFQCEMAISCKGVKFRTTKATGDFKIFVFQSALGSNFQMRGSVFV